MQEVKCYWTCLQGTYKEKNYERLQREQGIEVTLVSRDDIVNNLLPSDSAPLVIECKRINEIVLDTACLGRFCCILTKQHYGELVRDDMLETLATVGVSAFYLLSDLREFLVNITKIRDARDISTLISAILTAEENTHPINVGEISYYCALKNPELCDIASEIKKAAYLHDLGKLFLPESVLKAPRALTSTERKVIMYHPTYGSIALRKLGINGSFGKIAEAIVEMHHERLDGSGYPYGKNEIPLQTQMVAVVDVYDALRSNRPYRSRCDHDLALSYIRYKKEKFNQSLVDILEEVIRDGENLWD